MSIKLPVIVEYNGKGAKAAQNDLAALAKSYIKNTVTATAVLEVARKSIMAANEDAASQKQLALALRNTAGANDYAVSKSEKFIASLQYAVGVADDQLRPALATLATVTHDTAKAQDLLQTALDISAARGVDLETASLALSKAYQGNIGALRRLGLAVSDNAIKTKDFSLALSEIQGATKGAAKEAASGAEGGWKKLGIAIGDLSEMLGNELNKQLTPTIELLTKTASAATNADQKTKWFSSAVSTLTTSLIHALNPLSMFVGQQKEAAKGAYGSAAAQEALASRNRTSIALAADYARKLKEEKDAQTKAAAAAKTKSDAAKKHAQELRASLGSALDSVKQGVKDYIKSIGDAVSATVSLSDAVSKADQSVTNKSDATEAALKKRAAAYDALNLAQQTNDVEAYNKAISDLADAEKDVAAAAQMKTTTYTEQFRAQVQAAKEFAGNLQRLIGPPYNLSQAGVSQLLNLGAVAGNQVAKDLLDGSKGLTVGELNTSLSAVQAAGEAAGAATPGFGAILGATVGGRGSNVTINVTAGVGNKTEIAKQIVDALKEYDRTFGTNMISWTA